MCQKWRKKRVRLVIRCGFYLGPPWTVLAEILGDNSPIVGLSCVQISLGCIKASGSSGQKRLKNYTSINKKRVSFRHAEGQKTPGPFGVGVALRRGSYTTLGLRWERISSSVNYRLS